jgi:endogenous inhibitor of DNA gyrase (YacG/DUF329 family)
MYRLCPICKKTFCVGEKQYNKRYCSDECLTIAVKDRVKRKKQKSKKKMSTYEEIVEINRRAKALGIEYGDYVAKYGGL